jgi:cytochrome P450
MMTTPLFGPDMLPDPYRVYRQLRETDPVHWHEPLGAWVLTRYDDVDAALRDPRLSSTLGDVIPAPVPGERPRGEPGWQALRSLYAFVDHSLVFSDPPQHTRLRELVAKAFTPRAIEARRPHVQRLADEFLDAAQARGRLELIHDLAAPLPIAVIVGLLGMPDQDAAQLKQWCDGFLVPFGRDPATLTPEDRARVDAASAGLTNYVRTLLAEVRARPRDDLLSALVHAVERGDRLSDDELFANVVLFLIAGHENLTSLLGLGTLALLQNPDQLARLRAEPALLPRAVDELARWITPNQFIRRRALEAVTLGGKTIGAGQFLLLVLAAANRDPARFPDPDRLDFGRPPVRDLAFGHGPHVCLGVALARLEAEVVFATLIRRFPGLRLATDRLEYVDNFNVRQLKALPLTF